VTGRSIRRYLQPNEMATRQPLRTAIPATKATAPIKSMRRPSATAARPYHGSLVGPITCGPKATCLPETEPRGLGQSERTGQGTPREARQRPLRSGDRSGNQGARSRTGRRYRRPPTGPGRADPSRREACGRACTRAIPSLTGRLIGQSRVVGGLPDRSRPMRSSRSSASSRVAPIRVWNSQSSMGSGPCRISLSDWLRSRRSSRVKRPAGASSIAAGYPARVRQGRFTQRAHSEMTPNHRLSSRLSRVARGPRWVPWVPA
jgi:hypothetical protein